MHDSNPRDEDCQSSAAVEQETCKHDVAIKYKCIRCKAKIPQFGTVVDTGNINTFIKVVYVDESVSNKPPTPIASSPKLKYGNIDKAVQLTE